MRFGSVAMAGATAGLALTGASVDAQQRNAAPTASSAQAEPRQLHAAAPDPGASLAAGPLAPQLRSAPTASGAVVGDVELGMTDAAVVIVEYASLTCAACQHFQAEILPQLNARYILSGQAKFILRDYPTPPAPLAFAGFALARCGGRERFYPLVGDLFSRQTELLAAARAGAAKRLILEIGRQHGLAADAVETCLSDKELHASIERQIDEAPGLTTTPAVFVNGRRVPGFTFEAVATAIETERDAAAQAAAAQAVETAASGAADGRIAPAKALGEPADGETGLGSPDRRPRLSIPPVPGSPVLSAPVLSSPVLSAPETNPRP